MCIGALPSPCTEDNPRSIPSLTCLFLPLQGFGGQKHCCPSEVVMEGFMEEESLA